MRILLLIACATLIQAVEADPKIQVKTVWTAAAKAGDAWTCLQAEAWARSRKPVVRLGSALGESAVIGEPLFAFPGPIQQLEDLGDRLVVVAGSRGYVLAPDGRPLQASVPLPPGWRSVVGYDGQVVGVADQHDGLQFAAVRLADGQQTVSAKVPLGPTQAPGSVALADDGSAMAVEVSTQDPLTGATTVVTMLAVAGRAVRPIALPANPTAVGRNGAWLLAGNAPNLTLAIGDRRQAAAAAAVGPGMVAYIHEGKAQVIRADGREVPCPPGMVLGTGPTMATVGNWLVVASGEGAKVVSQGDLLGEGAGVESEQPSSLAFWRWSDLAADPAAKPVTTMPGHLTIATQFQAALWAWEGQRLDLIDLSGPEPRREAYLQASARINWVSSNLHCVRVYHPQGVQALYGPDKAQLWLGRCAAIDVKRRDLALVHRKVEERDQLSLVRLAADPAQRKETRLDVQEVGAQVRVSHATPDLVLAMGERNWWRSLGLDGKVIGSGREGGPKAQPAPRCAEWGWFFPVGRFWRDGVRVRSKAEPASDEPIATIELVDAWRVGSTVILLEVSGRVLITGRKRGEWVDLAPIAPADRFALAGTQPVLASGDEMRPVAALAAGPKLEQREGLGALLDLPAGAWRLEQRWRFTPPRGRQMEWDVERLGWRPVRLRSPEAGGLLVITPAVLIELDPAAAKMFGK